MSKLSKQEINEIYIARKTKLYDDGYEYAKNLMESEGDRKRVFFEIETRKHHFYFLNGMRKAHSDEGRLIQIESHFNEGYFTVKELVDTYRDQMISQPDKIQPFIRSSCRGTHHLEWVCGGEKVIKDILGLDVDLV